MRPQLAACCCAAAPFRAAAAAATRLCASACLLPGVYVEVYVCTPLSVCEERDIKHLYKKARQGIIKQFTGVSDPYEAPQKPELTIDSSSDIKDKVAQVHQYLRDQGYVLEAPPLSKCC